MYLNRSFPCDIERVKNKNIPVVIAGGTVEYHGPHCAFGCDSLIVEGLIERLSEIKEIMIAPSIYYSPSSYAVADCSSGTVHIPEQIFENYVFAIFMNFLQSGFHNIYVVIHHQYEQESLMPMTLSYMLAAKRAIMTYLEKTLGQGWWGSENYKTYYENLEKADNPFTWIKVIPTMSKDVQNETGYDHAGKYECSLLMALYPESVNLGRLSDIRHWFTESAREANVELGEKMANLSLSYLNRSIV